MFKYLCSECFILPCAAWWLNIVLKLFSKMAVTTLWQDSFKYPCFCPHSIILSLDLVFGNCRKSFRASPGKQVRDQPEWEHCGLGMGVKVDDGAQNLQNVWAHGHRCAAGLGELNHFYSLVLALWCSKPPRILWQNEFTYLERWCYQDACVNQDGAMSGNQEDPHIDLNPWRRPSPGKGRWAFPGFEEWYRQGPLFMVSRPCSFHLN